MKDYGVYVDAGRDGTKRRNRTKKSVLLSKSNKGRFPNLSALRKWVDKKPIRTRNLKTNQFIKRTPAAVDSMVYAIGRKIQRQGIEPTLFFSEPFTKHYGKLPDTLLQAVSKQVDDALKMNQDIKIEI